METVMRKAEHSNLNNSWIMLAMALGTMFSRMPFQAKIFYNFGATNYLESLWSCPNDLRAKLTAGSIIVSGWNRSRKTMSLSSPC